MHVQRFLTLLPCCLLLVAARTEPWESNDAHPCQSHTIPPARLKNRVDTEQWIGAEYTPSTAGGDVAIWQWYSTFEEQVSAANVASFAICLLTSVSRSSLSLEQRSVSSVSIQ